jgi:hypothetical protein
MEKRGEVNIMSFSLKLGVPSVLDIVLSKLSLDMKSMNG